MSVISFPGMSVRHDTSVGSAVGDFLADLEQAGRPSNTVRAYRSDLAAFAVYHAGPLRAVTPEVLRAYFATLAGLAPATRARKQASLASFLGWCFAQDLIDSDPMGRVSRVRLKPPSPRGVTPELVERVLAQIPARKRRDRLLFRLIYETGMRAGEALGLHVEDLDLSRDDERVRVAGKGGRHRTSLLDDPALVKQLRDYLKATRHRHGALFRAEKNGRGGGRGDHAARELWGGTAGRRGWSARCTSCGTRTRRAW